MERATLRDLAHQADLIAGTQLTGVGGLREPSGTAAVSFRRQNEEAVTTPQILPASARERLARGAAVQGTITFHRVDYYFAARAVGIQGR